MFNVSKNMDQYSGFKDYENILEDFNSINEMESRGNKKEKIEYMVEYAKGAYKFYRELYLKDKENDIKNENIKIQAKCYLMLYNKDSRIYDTFDKYREITHAHMEEFLTDKSISENDLLVITRMMQISVSKIEYFIKMYELI